MRGECLRAWMLPIATYPTAHRRGRQRLFPPSAILSSWPSRPPPFLRLLPPARIGVGLREKISVQYRWGNLCSFAFIAAWHFKSVKYIKKNFFHRNTNIFFQLFHDLYSRLCCPILPSWPHLLRNMVYFPHFLLWSFPSIRNQCFAFHFIHLAN